MASRSESPSPTGAPDVDSPTWYAWSIVSAGMAVAGLAVLAVLFIRSRRAAQPWPFCGLLLALFAAAFAFRAVMFVLQSHSYACADEIVVRVAVRSASLAVQILLLIAHLAALGMLVLFIEELRVAAMHKDVLARRQSVAWLRRCYWCHISLSAVAVLVAYLWPTAQHIRRFSMNNMTRMDDRDDDCCLWLKSLESHQPYSLVASLLILPLLAACFISVSLAASRARDTDVPWAALLVMALSMLIRVFALMYLLADTGVSLGRSSSTRCSRLVGRSWYFS